MQSRIPIDASADLPHAHDIATALAIRCGFGEIATERLGHAALAAAEGMLRHAGGGSLYLRPLQEEVTGAAAPQVELIAVDRPGDDAAHAPAASGPVPPDRLVALHELVTALDGYRSGRGCVLRMALSPADRPTPISLPAIAVGVLNGGDPTGQTAAGVNIHSARGLSCVVVGLGRGAEAARRVAALQGFGARVQQIDRVRAALPGSAGMALAAAQIEAAEGRLRVAGAGRFGACVLEPEAASTVIRRPLWRDGADGGYDGAPPRAVMQAQCAWPRQALLVLHGADLAWPWTLDGLAGLLQHHPAVIAAILHRDFSRTPGRGCVLVCRRSEECPTHDTTATTTSAPPKRRRGRISGDQPTA